MIHCSVLAGVLCGVAGFACAQAQFIPLGDLPGDRFLSTSFDVSAHGNVVVGDGKVFGGFAGYQAFRWEASEGMTSLGNLPSSYPESSAYGVSPGGRYIVGGSSSYAGHQAFMWSRETGIFGLGDLPGRDFLSIAQGVSAGGRVVVGYSDSAENRDGSWQAFRWTPEHGMQGLGFHEGSVRDHSLAHDVSSDGVTIVGSSSIRRGSWDTFAGFRWTESTGMVALDGLPWRGTIGPSEARAVSSDGGYAAGFSASDLADIDEAVLWGPDNQPRGLGYLPYDGKAHYGSLAMDVSRNGRVVVGTADLPLGDYHAFVWTEHTGMMKLTDALRHNGIDVEELGWRLEWGWSVSADGHWVAGQGRNPDGNYEAYLAYLPEIPAPSTLPPLALAALLATRRRR